MKSFPSNFAKAAGNLTGEAPLWILQISAGGSTYYLSDNAVTIAGWKGGVTTKAWISSWGTLTEGLSSGRLDEILQADMSITCLIDPDTNPNLEDLVTTYELEASAAVLYLWFRSLDAATDPPQAMLSGYIDSMSIPDETTITLGLTDGTTRLEKYIGTKVTRADFPEADEDDIGTVIPIPYGTVKKMPTRAVLSGAMTNIQNNLNATDITFTVSDATGLLVGDGVQIDDEQMLITGVDGDQLTVTRGANDTTAEIHSKGAVVWELREWFNYLVSDVPVDSITKAYCLVGDAMLDISAIAIGYTGQPGNEHPAYPGRAVISMPGYVTVTQAVSLLVNDGISLSDSLSLIDSIGVSDMLTILNNLGINDTTALTDTIGVSDLLTVVNNLAASDSIGLTDSIGISDLLTVANSLGISDSISINDALTINDALSILDGIGISNGSLSVSDTIGLTDGISVTDATHDHSGSTVTIALTPDNSDPDLNGWLSGDPATQAIDGNLDDGGTLVSNSSKDPTIFSFAMPIGYSGTPSRYRWAVSYGSSLTDYDNNFYIHWTGLSYSYSLVTGSSVKTTKYQSWQNVSSWDTIQDLKIGLRGAGAGNIKIWEVWLEVEYSTDTSTASANISKSGTVTKSGSASLSGSVSKTGAVTLTGDVTMDGSISKAGTVDLSGDVDRSGTISKTGTVTKTGTVDLTGDVDRSGTISKTGTVTKSGSVDLSGDVDRSGTISKTGTVDLSGSVIKTGTVTLSGNSTANTLVGDVVLADVVRQVSIDEQFNELLSACGFGALKIVGTIPNGYALNGIISEYSRAIDWLTSWAFQLRSWFRLAPDGPRLIVRPDALVPIKDIPAIRLRSDGRRVLKREKVSRTSTVNTINLMYDRDWTSSGESAYKAVESGIDQTSIDTYGEREEPNLFMLDFVTGQTMAASLLAFYLDYYAARHWQHTFDVYLDHCELEFGDAVQLDFLAGQAGTVTEAGFSPGDTENCDTMALTVIV